MRTLAGTVFRTILWSWVALGLWGLAAEALLSDHTDRHPTAARMVRILFTPLGHSRLLAGTSN